MTGLELLWSIDPSEVTTPGGRVYAKAEAELTGVRFATPVGDFPMYTFDTAFYACVRRDNAEARLAVQAWLRLVTMRMALA